MSFLRKEFKKPTYVSDINLSESKIDKSAIAADYKTNKIWSSKISWRIAFVCFFTVLLIQGVILSILLYNYERHQLFELNEVGRSTIVPLIKLKAEFGDESIKENPIREDYINRVFEVTSITGLSFYTIDYELIKNYGQPMNLTLHDRSSNLYEKSYRSSNGLTYEVIYHPEELHYPLIAIVQMDASHIKRDVREYIQEAIFTMFLISLLVTLIMILSVGHFLLGPVLFMRQTLLRASENPENPGTEDSPFGLKNEIGESIHIAIELIRQNADNIKRIKTAAEDQIHKLAYYDTLTTLPNRTFFLQSMGKMAYGEDGKTPGRFCVITIDLDHFKDINDTMGYNIGDAILRAVGKRLRSSLPENAVVARIAEDEFAAAMPITSDTTNGREIGARISSVIKASPFKVFTEDFQVRASVGVSTYPDDGTDVEQVLKNSDIALNRAKEEGRDMVKEYSEDFDRAVQQRFQILRSLRDALEHDQLLLHYQPQINLKTGKIIGAEALIRWWKPDNSKEGGHYVPPIEFIPIAEQSGLIVPIGQWVIETACTDMASMQKAGHDMRIAVNVSGAQFYQSNLIGFVESTLHETELRPNNLELEVTESVFMDDISHAITTLRNLHALGIELAIDDFGTGYSSLSYLRQFPIDRLKIDQSFIRNALNNPDDAAIAKTIIRLGHSLNLNVIAEGVETAEQQAFLIEEDCDEVQGFLYAKPMAFEDFEQFVKDFETIDVKDRKLKK